MCVEAWQNVFGRALPRFSGAPNGREATVIASTLQVADDWLVRCDRERRRRSCVVLGALVSRHKNVARHLEWYRAGIDAAPTTTTTTSSRIRTAERVRDLAWRNLWRGLVASAPTSTPTPAVPSGAVSDMRRQALWIDAVVAQAPIAIGLGFCVSLRTVTRLTGRARLGMCDAWRLAVPPSPPPLSPPPTKRPSGPVGQFSESSALAKEDLAQALRAIAVESATGRVYGRIERWRDAVGYLRRAVEATFRLHQRPSSSSSLLLYRMSTSRRFFETCVHLLDALHALGQHRATLVLACRIKAFRAATPWANLPRDPSSRAAAENVGKRRVLALWLGRLTMQCSLLDWLRFLRAERARLDPTHAASLAATERSLTEAHRKFEWRGPVWRSVLVARRALATRARNVSSPLAVRVRDAPSSLATGGRNLSHA